MSDNNPMAAHTAQVIITPAMVEAGNLAADRISTANVVESMDGLGGGMKKAEAPPEISQYFNRDESSCVLMFLAMDAVSPSPYGKLPSEPMELAGQEILSDLISVIFIKKELEHPDADRSLVTAKHQALLDDPNPPVYLMYQAMMQVAQAQLTQEA